MSKKIITYLSQVERFYIEIRLKQGASYRAIGRELNRSHTTISREVKRSGLTKDTYLSLLAENVKSKTRLSKKNKLSKNRILNKNDSLFFKIEKLLKKYSPLIISKKFLKGQEKISANTIYNHIYYLASLGKVELSKCLYNKHRKQKKQQNNSKKSKIPNRVSIHQRPKIVEKKTRLGDIEVDLICGGKTYLVTTIDRVSRKGFAKKVYSKDSGEVKEAIIKILKKYKIKIHTLTYDNGLEFSKHQEISKLFKCKSYFCDPYCSSQKGAIENFNKMVRKYLPKGTNFKNVFNDRINYIVDTINNTPRKVLDFKSANELFLEISGATTC